MQTDKNSASSGNPPFEEAAFSVAPDEIAILLPELRQAPAVLKLDLGRGFLDLLQGGSILRRVRLPADPSVGRSIAAFGEALILELDEHGGFTRSRKLSVLSGSSTGARP
jgi:hypothetical protein